MSIGDQGGTLKCHESELLARGLRYYPVSPEVRRKCIEQAVAVLENPESPNRAKMSAIKVIIAADSINVKRETNEITERHDQVMESAAGIRAALAIPGVREQLAALTEVSDATEKSVANLNGHAGKNGKSGPGHGLNGTGKH